MEVTPDVRPVTRAMPLPEDAPVVAEVVPPTVPLQPVIAPDPVVSDTPPAPIVPEIVVITSPNKRTSNSTEPTGLARPARPPHVVATHSQSMSGSRRTVEWRRASRASPLYQRWFQQFKEAQFNFQVGAGGVRELKQGKIDFALSDMPLTDGQIRDARSTPLHFPTAVAAVVPVYNVPGIFDDLRLTAELLAGIYLGEIRALERPTDCRGESTSQLTFDDDRAD